MSQSDFVTRGQALVNSGQFQEAVKVCRLGLLGRPTTVEGRVVLAQALLALKRFDEVLAEMRVALELDHTSITAQLLKGEALLRKGDPQAAIEVLQAVRLRAADPRIDELLAECREGGPGSRSHPSVNAPGKLDDHTRNYPNRSFADDDDDGEPTSGAFGESPTSVSTPGSKKRSAARPAARGEATPSPKVLAVGDKSGTVEVDPELEGIELDEDDFGEAVSPPSRSQPQPSIDNQRGAVLSSGRKAQLPAPNRPPASGTMRKSPVDISSVELDDDDVVELDSKETLLPEYELPLSGPGPVTRARNAVGMAPGPLETHTAPAAQRRTALPEPASRPTMHEPAMQPPPHLAQMIASAPHVMEVQRAQMSSTMRGSPGGPPVAPIASALPTMAAQPPPPNPAAMAPAMAPAAMAMTSLGMGSPLPSPAAARPTLAVSPAPDPHSMPGSPGWARATIAAGHPPQAPLQPPPGGLGMTRAEEPTSRPMPIDPGISSVVEHGGSSVAAMLEPSHSNARVLKTGMRKGRSKLQIAIWLLIGAAVIAGGVFVGFKFRAMRLEKKISDTRNIALGLASADTWKGLVRSRDRLAGIAQASPTAENRAALARTRAQIAFEFGDNVADAQKAVDGIANEAGFDVEIAGAYLALAQNNIKNALAAAGRADQLSPDDPAALYVTGQAELAAGDATGAVKHLEKAVEKEGRPLYRVALARALAEAGDTTTALAALDAAKIKTWFDAIDPDAAKELAGSGLEIDKLAANHPAIAIARVQIMTTAAQLGPKAKDLRAPLVDVINEGTKSLNDQPRGVSPAQVAFGHLALSALDFELGNQTSKAEFDAALKVSLDDQAFGERAMETLYLTGDFAGAKSASEEVFKFWPESRRARLALSKIAIAQGKPTDAIEALGKLDVDNLPAALVLRGQARLQMGDLVGAKSDFDNALKKASTLESALVGRAWVDLANGNVDDARARIRPKSPNKNQTASSAVIAVWANILRRGGVPNERDDARAMLETAVAGPSSVELLPVQLELARFYRELGDTRARDLYAKVIEVTGNPEIRIEFATYLIEFQDPPGGRESVDQLLKVAGDKPPPELLLEAARAHMLVGDHKGAGELLDQADKHPQVTRWKYDRERGRLALRKAALNDAALSLDKALDNCGDDLETFLIAAEVASADDNHGKLGEKIKSLLSRLKDAPEAKIVSGKLLGSNTAAAGKLFEAAGAGLDKASPRRKAQAQLGRAIVAYYGKDDPAAIDLFELAITLDPSLYEAYIYLADIYIQNVDKDPKKAPELAKKALERSKKAADYNPDNVDAYVHLGIAAHKLGDRATLKDAITRLGALAPNSEQLKTLQQLR